MTAVARLSPPIGMVEPVTAEVEVGGAAKCRALLVAVPQPCRAGSPRRPGPRLTADPAAGPAASGYGRGLAELAGASELAELSLAPATARTYLSAWGQFDAWCTERGIASLPADPATVAAYLAWATTAVRADGTLARDADGRPVAGRLRPVSAAVHLNAVNRAHRAAGLPAPGADPAVVAVMRGARRTHGVASRGRRDPLLLDGLRQAVAAVAAGEPGARSTRHATAVRDATALALITARGDDGRRLSVTAAARLRWSDLSCCTTTRRLVVRTAGRRPIVLTTPTGGACPARAVAALADAIPGRPDGPVLARVDGTAAGSPMTRQAVAKGIAGLGCRAADAVTRADASLPSPAPIGGGLAGDRTAALLLVCWAAALRRGNAAALVWSDLTDHEDGLAVVLRRSKTDPDGEGQTVWVPAGASPGTCPVTAVRRWRAALETAAGGPVGGDWPVFCSVDRWDRPRLRDGRPAAMSEDGIRRVVVAACTTAGLDGAWGSHSLRVGFVTQAARTPGVGVLDIQQVTGHRSLDVLSRYVRKVQAERRSPASLMGM